VRKDNGVRSCFLPKGGVAGLLMRQQSQQNIYYMTNHLGHVYGVFDQAGERLSQ